MAGALALKEFGQNMDTALDEKLDKTGDASNVTATFSQATTRANLTSKEKLSVSLGKIMKWIADLANGAASTLLGTNLTASRALVSDSNGKVGASSVSSTELGYLAGAKSKIQDQLDSLNTNLSGKASTSHTHDDRYYTESEMDTKLSGKAASSHTHTKSQITDFPSSMPASDVYSWAKATSKPSYSWSEITGKPSTFSPSSHTHDDRYYTETEVNNKIGGGFYHTIDWLGYGFSLYGYAFAYHIGSGTYIIKLQGTVTATSGNASSSDFNWGFNLTAILDYCHLKPDELDFREGSYKAYTANTLLRDAMGYGTGFQGKITGGYKVLTPGRYHNTTSSFGAWPSNHDCAKQGTFYDATIVVCKSVVIA